MDITGSIVTLFVETAQIRDAVLLMVAAARAVTDGMPATNVTSTLVRRIIITFSNTIPDPPASSPEYNANRLVFRAT